MQAELIMDCLSPLARLPHSARHSLLTAPLPWRLLPRSKHLPEKLPDTRRLVLDGQQDYERTLKNMMPRSPLCFF